jgi:hypothetical protein
MKTAEDIKLKWQKHNRDHGMSWNEVAELVNEVSGFYRKKHDKPTLNRDKVMEKLFEHNVMADMKPRRVRERYLLGIANSICSLSLPTLCPGCQGLIEFIHIPKQSVVHTLNEGEIKSEAKKHSEHIPDKQHRGWQFAGFMLGARWVIEQLTKPKEE